MASTAPAPIAATSESRELRKIVLPGQTPEGQHVLSVLHKRTYDFVNGGLCRRAAEDLKLWPGDVHYGDPMNTSVKFESDFVPFKLATDVVLNGTAHAPGGEPTQAFTARLAVGEAIKDVVVVGDRHCIYQEGAVPLFTDPAFITTMELRYERAFGGVDIYSDPKVPCGYARNHLGKGFAVTNVKRAIDKLELPNFEDPVMFLTPETLTIGHFMYWEQLPPPAGFGWYLKYWQPRAGLAGVMPADRQAERELREVYAKLVPEDQKAMWEQTGLPDMDFRFFNGASPGLILPYLRGDEPVYTFHLSDEGHLAFQLPGDRPRIGLDIGSGVQEPEVVLHTVMMRMEDRQVDLVWRGAVPYEGPDWLPQMRKCEVSIE
jgi:hypothetical protein